MQSFYLFLATGSGVFCVLGSFRIGCRSDFDALICLGPNFETTSVRALPSGYVWFDWFSIPQIVGEDVGTSTKVDQLSAIISIPAYVREATCFAVLCPSASNTSGTLSDFNTWKSRAWCRAEQLCPGLSLTPESLLLVCVVEQYDIAA